MAISRDDDPDPDPVPVHVPVLLDFIYNLFGN